MAVFCSASNTTLLHPLDCSTSHSKPGRTPFKFFTHTRSIASTTQFSLSKIHRLIRPLNTSICSFHHTLDQIHRSLQSPCDQSRLYPHSSTSPNKTDYRKLQLDYSNRYRSRNKNRRLRQEDEQDQTNCPGEQNEDEMEFIPNLYRPPSKRRQIKSIKTINPTRAHRVQSPTTSSRRYSVQPQITSPIFLRPKLSKTAIVSSSDRFNLLLKLPHPSNSQPQRSCHSLQESHIDLKIDKMILAYKNILDGAVLYDPYPPHLDSDHPEHHGAVDNLNQDFKSTDRLTSICARLIGRSIESTLRSPTPSTSGSGSDSDFEQPIPNSIWTETDHQTSLMDEWYDSIPILYRKHALTQHALTSILTGCPTIDPFLPDTTYSDPKMRSPLVTRAYQKLLKSIHQLHLTYISSPLIIPQLKLALPYLFRVLHPTDWHQIYVDYDHSFGLTQEWIEQFQTAVDRLESIHFFPLSNNSGEKRQENGESDRGAYLKFWCDWRFGLNDLVDQMVDKLGFYAFQKWISERERLIRLRSSWRKKTDEIMLGLESSDFETDDDFLNEKMIIDFDQRTSSNVLKWIDSLIISSCPNSNNPRASRTQLNQISRLCFESLTDSDDQTNRSDQAFLLTVSITLESHRLALFGLKMFNLRPYASRIHEMEEEANYEQNEQVRFDSKHHPMRLQLILPKSPLTHLDSKILNRSSKIFFRTHRSTRLLRISAVPPVISSSSRYVIQIPNGEDDTQSVEENGGGEPFDDRRKSTREKMWVQKVVISGLDSLLKQVISSEFRLESIAKSWVESLLLSDPSTWTPNPEEGSEKETVEVEQDRRNQSQAVRKWLEDWLMDIERVERERIKDNLSSEVEEEYRKERDEEEEEDDDFTLKSKVKKHVSSNGDDDKLDLICTCSSKDEQALEIEDKPKMIELNEQQEIEDEEIRDIELENESERFKIRISSDEKINKRGVKKKYYKGRRRNCLRKIEVRIPRIKNLENRNLKKKEIFKEKRNDDDDDDDEDETHFNEMMMSKIKSRNVDERKIPSLSESFKEDEDEEREKEEEEEENSFGDEFDVMDLLSIRNTPH